MSDRLKSFRIDDVRPTAAAADLAADLVSALATRVHSTADEVQTLVRTMSLEPVRVAAEYAYLLIVITQFCIDAGVDEPRARAALDGAFVSAAQSVAALRASARGIGLRRRAYGGALSNPHPEFGRAYSVGRVFARYCDASLEVAVIEFGMRTYMDQLPPMLGRLRSVTVV